MTIKLGKGFISAGCFGLSPYYGVPCHPAMELGLSPEKHFVTKW